VIALKADAEAAMEKAAGFENRKWFDVTNSFKEEKTSCSWKNSFCTL
jgi:hypothetical protein